MSEFLAYGQTDFAWVFEVALAPIGDEVCHTVLRDHCLVEHIVHKKRGVEAVVEAQLPVRSAVERADSRAMLVLEPHGRAPVGGKGQGAHAGFRADW
jgi:hypothetical protein